MLNPAILQWNVPVVLTTMDPTFVNSNVTWTFTNGNLTVNGNSSAFGQDRSTVSHSSGKWYFEVKFTTAPSINAVVGIISSADTNGNWPGKTLNSYGIICNQTAANQGKNNNVNWPGSTWSATFIQGDIIGFAVDLNSLTLNVYKNGTLLTPSLNVITNSGTYYAAVAIPNGGSAYSFTTNFGQTAFSTTGGVPPSGYVAW